MGIIPGRSSSDNNLNDDDSEYEVPRKKSKRSLSSKPSLPLRDYPTVSQQIDTLFTKMEQIEKTLDELKTQLSRKLNNPFKGR